MDVYKELIDKIVLFSKDVKNYAETLVKYNKVEDLVYLAEKLGYTIRLIYGADTFIDEFKFEENSEEEEEEEEELKKIKEQRKKTIEESKNIGLDFTNDTSKIVFESFDVDIEDIIIGSDEEESEEEEVPITRKRTMKLKYDFE